MKKVFLLTALIVAVGSVAGAQVVGSVHDLSSTGGAFSTTANTGEVCVFCHTPHAADATSGPLWNRGATALTAYTMYDNSYSSTMDMTVAAAPQGVSAACLSCHDGSVGFDVLINAPTTVSGAYNYNAAGASVGWTFSGASSLSGRPVTDFGDDLTSEHPISITYDEGQDGDFKTLATVQGSTNVQLYGASENQVECGSCHDPHDQTNVPFLRVANTGSQLCTTCHSK